MPRKIVHLDADAFFASCEQAADTRLRGKPVAVLPPPTRPASSAFTPPCRPSGHGNSARS